MAQTIPKWSAWYRTPRPCLLKPGFLMFHCFPVFLCFFVAQWFSQDEFTLLKLGTSIFFDNFESALEEATLDSVTMITVLTGYRTKLYHVLAILLNTGAIPFFDLPQVFHQNQFRLNSQVQAPQTGDEEDMAQIIRNMVPSCSQLVFCPMCN